MAGAITTWKDTDILDLLRATRSDGDTRGVIQVATKDAISKVVRHITRVSNVVESIPVAAAPTTLTLEGITVADIPVSTTLVHAFLSLITRKIDNMDQVNDNSLDGATVPGASQVVQIRPTGGSWTDAMNFVDDQYEVPNAVARPGYKQTSNIDVAGDGKVNGNGTYELRWLLSKATFDSLEMRDAYFALEMEFEV